jgi:enoyl-CoA hydratase
MSADTTGDQRLVLVDDPAPRVRRLTLNRPEKRNAISNAVRTELYDALHAADRDPDVGVTVIRGAGACFSSGYDLKSSLSEDQPFYTAPGDGAWSRHVADGWSRIWDLAKPVIAQVHGYAMAGGTELMAACDLVYIAEDAQLSYPVVRVVSPPDFQYHVWLVGMRPAMEMMLTGDAIDGREAVRVGMANRAFPAADLERETLAMAARVASIPSDLLQINKRTVHRAMEFQGVRTATRAGSELQGLASNLETSKQFFGGDLSAAVKQAARTPATQDDPGGSAGTS